MSTTEQRNGRVLARAGRVAVLTCAAMAAGVAASTPAAADVIELAADGRVLVRAADRGSLPAPATSAEPVGDVDLPAEAMTLAAGSVAPAAYASAVEQVAEAHQLSPALLEALVWQESRWRPGARSRAGAVGLAQLMPGTARDLGVDPRDPLANLVGGARYLRQQLNLFNGDIELALAAYNAGPRRVLRAGSVPRIAETQAYVRSVVDRLSGSSLVQGVQP